MSDQFVNPLPKFNPPMMFRKQKHIFSRLSVSMINHIIEWTKKEYWDSIRYWAGKGKFRNVRLEMEEFSSIRLMATLSIFDELILFFQYFPYVWSDLPKKSRDFLAKSYEFKTLMNQKQRS